MFVSISFLVVWFGSSAAFLSCASCGPHPGADTFHFCVSCTHRASYTAIHVCLDFVLSGLVWFNRSIFVVCILWSSSRCGHLSLLCFIYTLSFIHCNHGHSCSGSVSSGRQFHICSGILYFCSFCSLRLGSQWDLDAFCLDMFSQSVTCKHRHVRLHSACCFLCVQQLEFSRRRHVHVLLHLFIVTFPHAARVCQQELQQNTTLNTFRGPAMFSC